MSEIEFVNLGADDYDRAKRVLNRAKHPGFVGRELFYRCATTGVVCIAVLDGDDCGVAMIAKEKLQALSIVASVQGKGVGSALMRRLQPKWVSAIAERISFFERLGYTPLGAPKVGQNGKHATQLMQRGEISNASTSDSQANAPVRVEIADPPAHTEPEVELPASKVAITARFLAEQARRKHLPNREELTALAFDMLAEAMENVQVFETHNGTKKYPSPQRQAANKSFEIAISLVLPQKQGKEVPVPTEDDVSRLVEMGWRVIPKPNGGFELDPVVPPAGEQH